MVICGGGGVGWWKSVSGKDNRTGGCKLRRDEVAPVSESNEGVWLT